MAVSQRLGARRAFREEADVVSADSHSLLLPVYPAHASESMDSLVIDTADVLSRFDRLVAAREILWTPSTPRALTHKGFQFEFRVCPALASKPNLPTSPTNSTAAAGAKLTPQSDIHNNSPDFYIASLPPLSSTPTHSLILNAYSIFRPQYLLLTTLPSHNQCAPLTKPDLAAAWTTLRALGPSHWAIYNCGPESGCSRVHKHMQIFPPPRDGFRFFPDLGDATASADVPFRYFLRRLQPTVNGTGNDDEIADVLLATYHDLLTLARSALQIPPSESWATDPVPHNFVLLLGWMMVIPRTKAGVGGVSANSAAMVGIVWVKGEREVEEWKERGPANVLGELGIRA